MKERLDVLMVQRQLAPSREKAKALIMAGCVLVDGEREDKAGTMFADKVEITVKGNTLKYVSRGGLKLKRQWRNLILRWTERSAWMWELLQEALLTVCFRMEL